ncbi:MAG: hypothetical protein EPN14_03680 [Gallionella sp.]|nr:MAG: hypothetical protein EPN14_03680 [Gallionella sp.]
MANLLKLIADLEQLVESVSTLSEEIKQQAGFVQNRLIDAEEQMWMLKQRADHDHDGLPFSDTL